MDLFKQWVSLLREIGFSVLCDIAIVTLIIYVFLAALKRTRRSGLIFAGIVIVAAVYLAALKFNLLLTVALLHGFFTVILVALVVIFREDHQRTNFRAGQVAHCAGEDLNLLRGQS